VILGVRMGVTLALTVAFLSACATRPGTTPGFGGTTTSSTATTTTGPSVTPPVVTVASCQAQAAFSASIALGITGEPTAVKAAERFVLHGSVPGYGDASSRWQITRHDPNGVTLTAGTVRLHAFQLTNKTWVVDSGERCAS
jgi:hypothetical protein